MNALIWGTRNTFKAVAQTFKFLHMSSVFVAESTHKVASAPDSVAAWRVLARIVRRQSSKYPQAASMSGSLEQRCSQRRSISQRRKSGRFVVPPAARRNIDDDDDDNDADADGASVSRFGVGLGLSFLFSCFVSCHSHEMLVIGYRSCK
jgi:hypothetical protein